MPFWDSMFLLEIEIEELNSYIDCKQFIITSQFANVFHIKLKDLNISNTKIKAKTKVRKVKTKKVTIEEVAPIGQSILFTIRIDTLVATMKKKPIELSLYDKCKLGTILGSTHIPWSPVFIDYLYKLKAKVDASPANIRGAYNIYDNFTAKPVATIRLSIILTHLKDKVASFRPSCEANYPHENFGLKLKSTNALNTRQEPSNNYLSNKRSIQQNNCNSKYKTKKTPNCRVNRSEIIKEKKVETVAYKENNLSKPLIETLNTDEKWAHPVKDNLRTHNVKSDTNLYEHKQTKIVKTKSCSAINSKPFNILHYIFGDIDKAYRDQVLCVGYLTVENECEKYGSSTKNSLKSDSGGKFEERSRCLSDFPESLTHLVTDNQCSNPGCNNRIRDRKVPLIPDDRIKLKLSNSKKESSNITEKLGKVVQGMNTNVKIEKKGCSCECTFEFMKRTTYCGICGGYERPGEDMSKKILNAPFPCPIYHKLGDKNKQKTLSTSGSDRSRTKGEESLKSYKKSTKSSTTGAKPKSKKVKGKRKRKNDIFRFNYGYKAPQLGHIRCVAPCTGTLEAVPKNMGWLWTADNVPGIKFRPKWKPGASNKHVVRALRLARYPDKKKKKKKKDIETVKKPLKRPLLTVAKKNGEYTVTMETMRIFSRPRAQNQYPYEDKPLVTYTVGRTEEENRERRKQKERAKRRLERDQRAFIQSTFRNMCNEICRKTYQQALGILPGGEDPVCECYPKYPGPYDTNLELSCSCSEDSKLTWSDTDSDEWIVEFTPPCATFDPSYMGKRILKTDNSCQYTYLDYKVKLIDRNGNQVPRFFKGPDGKTQCSDLGGFWSPDHKWLEINTDGYVGPDGRWAPMTFTGPNGEQIDCDTGMFQVGNSGIWLVVGVDGYVDATGKWKFYRKPKGMLKKRDIRQKDAGGKKQYIGLSVPSKVTWSCFGDANARELSKMGIFGHGQDRKLLLQSLQDLGSDGEDIIIPQPSVMTPIPSRKRDHHLKTSEHKCKHSIPSNKGIVAVDGHGRKTLFKLKDYKNKRPKERINKLTDQGISLSSFHAPCFHSFISQEVMKKHLFERRIKMANPSE